MPRPRIRRAGTCVECQAPVGPYSTYCRTCAARRNTLTPDQARAAAGVRTENLKKLKEEHARFRGALERVIEITGDLGDDFDDLGARNECYRVAQEAMDAD